MTVFGSDRKDLSFNVAARDFATSVRQDAGAQVRRAIDKFSRDTLIDREVVRAVLPARHALMIRMDRPSAF